ncbi:ATP-binding protein [Corallococcus macrosporus]|uniref:histidine kinase n=1 Tax=Corallococcus macrosporus DSM 14697 TaxID=1189310 RepID=A0A250JMG2_9BACT|nr:ATP-binding protein [Corallococcus macrosporus]ATB44853.1 histidine kinase [Corallococcus macrosporus DSM 14697]
MKTAAEAGAAYGPFDAMSVGVCVIRDGRFVYVNEALVTMSGHPREAVLGEYATLLVPPASAEELDARHARRKRGEPVPTTYETLLRSPEGERRVELTVIPSGLEWVVLVRDVSARARRRSVLQRLAELGASLPSLRTEGEVLRRMFSGVEELELACAWLSPERLGVRLGQTFVPPGMVPPEAAALSGRWVRDIVGQWPPLLKRAWRDGAAYTDELPQEAERFLRGARGALVRQGLQRAGQTRAIAVRVDVEGQPRAVLALVADWLREEELPPVRLFGAQVSAALDAALTISRLSAQNTALAALNRLASVTASAPHAQALFAPGTDEIAGLLGCDAVAVLLPADDGEVELAYARGLDLQTSEDFTRRWRGESLCVQAQREGVPLEREVESCPEDLGEELRRQGFRTVVVVPLRVRSRGVGTLAALFRERRPLTPLERETLQAMGSHFAAAIESHRLLHELRGRAEDLALLHEVAKAMAATLELDTLLHIGATSLARIVDTSEAYVFLPDGPGERLQPRAMTGASPELRGHALPLIPADASLASVAFHTREVVMVEDVRSDLRVNEEVRLLPGARAFLVLPLVVHERPMGVMMAVETRRPRRFTPAEVERASAIANQLALAREGARLVEDLQASYVELARTQAQLVRRERLAALGELSAVVAHEVRNPLGAIFNSVASLRRIVGPDSAAVPLLDIVGEESDRLNRIVADLLTFARPPAPPPYAVPLSPLVEDAVRGALAEAPGQVRVEMDLAEDVPSVTVDERMMRQAFLNLAINAVQAMPQGGMLRASVRRATGTPEVEVQFADSGPGISPDVRARIFEPFFTTKAKGTGLGLAVVKRIIESHQGRVALESQPGQGTTFRLYLPLDTPGMAAHEGW